MGIRGGMSELELPNRFHQVRLQGPWGPGLTSQRPSIFRATRQTSLPCSEITTSNRRHSGADFSADP